jgi:hypothetical protein
VAIRLGPLRPSTTKSPWLHFQLVLRAGAPATTPGGGAPPVSPLEFIAADGQELITWLLGLQAVVVPADQRERLTLGIVGRRRLRMIARRNAYALNLDYRQFWVTTILNAAATYDPSQDSAADRWHEQRDSLGGGGAALRSAARQQPPTPSSARRPKPPPTAQQSSSAFEQAATSSSLDPARFGAAARRAEERRSLSGRSSGLRDDELRLF